MKHSVLKETLRDNPKYIAYYQVEAKAANPGELREQVWRGVVPFFSSVLVNNKFIKEELLRVRPY
jgi:hypothetical protein